MNFECAISKLHAIAYNEVEWFEMSLDGRWKVAFSE